MPNTFLRYLLSNRNLAAMAAAGAITALYLVGIIDKWWWALAGAAYAAVWLLPLSTKPAPAPVAADLSTQQALEWLEDRAMGRLPASARSILADILVQVKDILPRLKEMEGAGLLQVENRAALKQTVKQFLPGAIETYLRLPPLYARTAKVAAGQTAEEVLLGQLRTLQTQVHAIQGNILSSDVDALVAQSQFLSEKFSQPTSPLDAPSSAK
ncbi:hypothetical protein [Burkholderia cenocepacia]|uniref:hypothetical protein n=1 Tax=Burkholderia cenocepacia TaxID=95486 RepID=UPI000760B90B|nr:hypothetical protein [Burkholderia cenocepacia]KWU19119.1 hypothetical protein AS149_12795 [Burkholderia cenocepacia]